MDKLETAKEAARIYKDKNKDGESISFKEALEKAKEILKSRSEYA